MSKKRSAELASGDANEMKSIFAAWLRHGAKIPLAEKDILLSQASLAAKNFFRSEALLAEKPSKAGFRRNYSGQDGNHLSTFQL